MPDPHIALLGDSIFDNATYTAGAPDVITHVRAGLPTSWRASLLAVDGSTTQDLALQLERIATDVTHIVVSIGGNDALLNSDVIDLPVSSTAQALSIFGQRADAFRSSYKNALDAVLALNRRTIVCTIYEGNLEPGMATIARVALMFFNDAILRVAFERHLDVIDLRLVCNEASDYANPIEPSGGGGEKIAAAVLSATGAREPADGSRVAGCRSP